MIKAIFWDNDGVLVDTEALYFQATQEVLAEQGITLSREDFTDISLARGESALALAAPAIQSQGDMGRLRERRNHRYSDLLKNNVAPMEGVYETLNGLRGKLSMAIVTGCRKEHFDIIHNQTGILPFFDFVLMREDYHFSKPHPEAYLKALAISGLHPQDCVVIEDSVRGLKAAHAAGIPCWVIPNQLTKGSDFSLADKTLNALSDLPPLLFSE